jgi:hypothetical protein
MTKDKNEKGAIQVILKGTVQAGDDAGSIQRLRWHPC